MSEPIRVLHVIGKRPQGGIGTFLLNVHRNIDTQKVQFDYLLNADEKEGFFDKEVKKLGGRVYLLPELSYKNTYQYLKQLNQFFKVHKEYNIIHGHSVNVGIFYFSLAKRYGIKHRIAHSHSTRYSDSKLNSIRNFILQIPLKLLVNQYFACSTKAAEFLFGKKQVEKVHIMRNPIDLNKFKYDDIKRQEIRKTLNIEDKLVVGHIGAFLPVKNHAMVLKIFKEIYINNKKSYLLLVGEGKLKEDIEKMAISLEINEAVKFLGTRTDIENILCGIDVFVFPSFFEGLPLVCLEAQAAGVQSYLSNAITEEIKVTELVEFLSIEETPEYWAQCILRNNLIGTHKDTYKIMKEKGLDIKDNAKIIEKFYTNLEIGD